MAGTFVKVQSSNIQEVKHEKDILTIKFKGSGVYEYSPVSLKDYDEFMKAESKGSFFHQHIKNNPGITTKKIS